MDFYRCSVFLFCPKILLSFSKRSFCFLSSFTFGCVFSKQRYSVFPDLLVLICLSIKAWTLSITSVWYHTSYFLYIHYIHIIIHYIQILWPTRTFSLEIYNPLSCYRPYEAFEQLSSSHLYSLQDHQFPWLMLWHCVLHTRSRVKDFSS